MPYDEDLANRVCALHAREDGFGERKMFGGLCPMIQGSIYVGASGDRRGR